MQISNGPHYSILGRLLANRAAIVEHFGPPMPAVGPELAGGYHRNAVVSRRAEFATGRHCAREACRLLGRPCELIGVRDDRSPDWPAGVIGTITHCKGYVAAAVTTCDRARYLGIDAEPDDLLPENLIPEVAFGPELSWLYSSHDTRRWAKRLFSIKEAVFKAYWPIHQSWLDFRDIILSVDPAHGKFDASISKNFENITMSGSFLIEKPFFVSVVIE